MEWLTKFPQGVSIDIRVVFPGEYRIGYRYANIQYIPGFPHYYPFEEAMRRCWEAFNERFPQAITEHAR